MAELLEDGPEAPRLEPFTMTEHKFASFAALYAWLGDPEVKPVRRDATML